MARSLSLSLTLLLSSILPSFLPIFLPSFVSSYLPSFLRCFLSFIFTTSLPSILILFYFSSLSFCLYSFLSFLFVPLFLHYFYLFTTQIVAGYGLTETSPTLLNRVVERNVLGTVGQPPVGTEIKVIDPETREEVPIGQGGILVLTITG